MHQCPRFTWVAVLVGVFALTGLARGQANDIEIVGFSPNQKLLKWTVTNHGAAPVSRLVFPVDRVNLTHRPAGWEIEQFDRLRRGNLVYRSTSPEADIRRGQSLEFECTLDHRALQLREGTVSVGLRNGSTVEVAGVLLPTSHSAWQVYAVPAFLAALLGVVVLVRLLKRSRTSAAGGSDSWSGPKNGTPEA